MTRLWAYWNWKSAVLSAGCRGLIFFSANVSGGWTVALAALNTEFLYRAAISGWFGSLTERAGRPGASRRAVQLLIAATVVAHVAEWGVHVRPAPRIWPRVWPVRSPSASSPPRSLSSRCGAARSSWVRADGRSARTFASCLGSSPSLCARRRGA